MSTSKNSMMVEGKQLVARSSKRVGTRVSVQLNGCEDGEVIRMFPALGVVEVAWGDRVGMVAVESLSLRFS